MGAEPERMNGPVSTVLQPTSPVAPIDVGLFNGSTHFRKIFASRHRATLRFEVTYDILNWLRMVRASRLPKLGTARSFVIFWPCTFIRNSSAQQMTTPRYDGVQAASAAVIAPALFSSRPEQVK